MKALIKIALIVLTTNVFANEVSYTNKITMPAANVYSSMIEKMELDKDVYFYNKYIHEGQIRVNDATSTVTLELIQPRPRCPKETPFCVLPAVMPMPITIELPIISRQADGCGSEIIEAELDRRPVDGLLERIVVVDNTLNRCMHLIPLPAVEAEYSTVNPWNQLETFSNFEGSPFRRSTHRPIFFPADMKFNI